MSSPTDDLSGWRAGRWRGRSVRAIAATVGVRTALAAAVLVPVAATTALRVANNAPEPLPPALAAAHGWLAVAGPTAVATLVVLLGVAHREWWPRVGLVVAGVFGLVGLHVPVATAPAVVGVCGGAALPVLGRVVEREANDRPAVADSQGRAATLSAVDGPLAVAGVVWLGLALALAGATGVVDATARPVASTLALVGVALVPAALPWRGGRAPVGHAWPWLVGAVAAGVVLWVGSAAPFVTGAAVLVGFGVVGVPLVVVAAAAGGVVAGLAGAVARDHWPTALAAGLLLAAGVPAALPRALPAAAAVALLAGGEPA